MRMMLMMLLLIMTMMMMMMMMGSLGSKDCHEYLNYHHQIQAEYIHVYLNFILYTYIIYHFCFCFKKPLG